jgi:hypothetical protein
VLKDANCSLRLHEAAFYLVTASASKSRRVFLYDGCFGSKPRGECCVKGDPKRMAHLCRLCSQKESPLQSAAVIGTHCCCQWSPNLSRLVAFEHEIASGPLVLDRSELLTGQASITLLCSLSLK